MAPSGVELTSPPIPPGPPGTFPRTKKTQCESLTSSSTTSTNKTSIFNKKYVINWACIPCIIKGGDSDGGSGNTKLISSSSSIDSSCSASVVRRPRSDSVDRLLTLSDNNYKNNNDVIRRRSNSAEELNSLRPCLRHHQSDVLQVTEKRILWKRKSVKFVLPPPPAEKQKSPPPPFYDNVFFTFNPSNNYLVPCSLSKCYDPKCLLDYSSNKTVSSNKTTTKSINPDLLDGLQSNYYPNHPG